jgi:glutathione S-transferase
MGCCETTRKQNATDKAEKSPRSKEKSLPKPDPVLNPPSISLGPVQNQPCEPTEATLIDLKTHNKAEAIRLAFAVAKVNYRESLLTTEEWAEQSKSFPHAKLPILEVSGRQLVGGEAGLRYVCQTRGMYPVITDIKAVYRCEAICEGIAEQTRELVAGIRQGALAQNRAYKETRYLLRELDSAVQGSSPYLVGDILTMADLMCLDFLWTFFLSPTKRLAHGQKVPSLLADYILALLKTHPELQAAIDSRLSRP